MPTLKYVGPIDEVEIPGVAVVKHGDEFEADADVAGTAPEWRKARKGEDTSRLHHRGEGTSAEVLDLGTGLLAQVGNYELVKTPAKKKDD